LSPKAQAEILSEGARRIRDEFGAILERLIEEAQGQRHAEERKAAAAQYRSLAALHPLRQEALIDERAEYQTWAMVEKYCEESRKAASDDPKRALLLANLALRCAQSMRIAATLRSRLEGFAWAFIANARRVASDLPAAEEAFGLAWAAWRRGKRAGAALPLGTWQLQDLEASLRREQLRLRAALSLLSRALKSAPARVKGRLLLNKATIYIVMGEPNKAIAVLQDAEGCVAHSDDPQLYFALRFNLGVILAQAGRIAELQQRRAGAEHRHARHIRRFGQSYCDDGYVVHYGSLKRVSRISGSP
jgi:tetratricopeptide (TPR) repeat protein